jgi:predicted MFS family arabinose efflux permease
VATPAWRVLYAFGLFGIPLSLLIGRRLPESRRFLADASPAAAAPLKTRPHRFRQRLVLLATASFLFNLFFIPASQFRNEFLRKERFFSAAHITLFVVITVVPGALGILFGGRLADTRGRRLIGTISLLGGASATVLSYVARGWAMWAFAAAATIVGAAVVPALSVYGAELFPTALRGLANGVITAVGRIGSVVGLIVVGVLASTLGHFGPAFALVALGPLSLAVLVIVAFPETAGRELEELNPEDRAPPPGLPATWGV